MRLFTIGYEKRSIETFPATLSAAGVGVLVDVRETPWSHKPGFSKTALTAALAGRNIGYEHAKFAGNPKTLRATAATPEECLKAFRRYLGARPAIVEQLAATIERIEESGRFACLMCYERQPVDCHRGILAEAVAKVRKRVEVVHLTADVVELPLFRTASAAARPPRPASGTTLRRSRSS